MDTNTPGHALERAPKNGQNRQRFVLLVTGIFIVASSIGSACYYGVRTGVVFPFIAPLPLLPSSITSQSHWWLAAVAVAGIVFGLGALAWYCCRPFLTYSFVVGAILLVIASEYLTYLLGLTGCV